MIQGKSGQRLIGKLKKGIKVDAIITDPPFNIVEKIGDNIHLIAQSAKQESATITKESMSFDVGFDQISWLSRVPKLLKQGGNLIIFNDWENMGDIAKELENLGCIAIMPLAAPIGSGLGIQNKLSKIIDEKFNPMK